MNAIDVLKYGHAFLVEKVSGLPEEDWYPTGVVGFWSVKDIIAHLASFEQLLVELLNSFAGANETPTLERFRADPLAFNDEEVEKRRHLSAEEAWAEYVACYEEAVNLMEAVPVEQRRREGRLPWYGPQYSLEDFVVYSFYGHKREHGAQIDKYREELSGAAHSAEVSIV